MKTILLQDGTFFRKVYTTFMYQTTRCQVSEGNLYRFIVLENKLMPSKCGPKKDEMREDSREMHKKELYNSYYYHIFSVECTAKFRFKTLQKGGNLNDLDIEGETRMKYTLKKSDGVARTRTIWFRICTVVGPLRHAQWNSCSKQNPGNFLCSWATISFS